MIHWDLFFLKKLVFFSDHITAYSNCSLRGAFYYKQLSFKKTKKQSLSPNNHFGSAGFSLLHELWDGPAGQHSGRRKLFHLQMLHTQEDGPEIRREDRQQEVQDDRRVACLPPGSTSPLLSAMSTNAFHRNISSQRYICYVIFKYSRRVQIDINTALLANLQPPSVCSCFSDL